MYNYVIVLGCNKRAPVTYVHVLDLASLKYNYPLIKM